MKRFVRVAAVGVAISMGACTTGQLNRTPPITFTPTSAVLRMAVGNVNFNGANTGLNVLVTDRAPSGYTAIPLNTATLTGPGGFAGTAGSADPGAGSASVLTGSAKNAFPISNTGVSTILCSADGYGLGPPGSSSASVSNFPAQPQFGDVAPLGGTFSAQRALYGDPPAYPAPSGPQGYPEGFYLLAFAGAPPTGTYTLTVNYSQNGIPGQQAVSATLGAATLPAFPATPLTYAGDGAGGGNGTINVPAGVTEVLINITDLTTVNSAGTPIRATVKVSGIGVQAFNIPNSTGFITGDSLRFQAFGFDYDAVGLGPPSNLSQSPALPVQADVTVAPQTAFTQ